jgi:hypothetical protein
MTSEVNPAMPRFRLVYEKLVDRVINIRFEIAMPNAPKEFEMYLEGNSRKTS